MNDLISFFPKQFFVLSFLYIYREKEMKYIDLGCVPLSGDVGRCRKSILSTLTYNNLRLCLVVN